MSASTQQTITLPNGDLVVPNEHGFITGEVRLTVNELIDHLDLDGVLDQMSELLTGSPLLTDISYHPLRIEDGMIVFEVTGHVGEIINAEESEP
jgi:hypothetical protein